MDFLPLVRFPWRRDDTSCEVYKEFILDEVLGVTGFDLTKSVKMKNTPLGVTKLSLQLFVLVAYVGMYCLIARKSYLSIATVTGIVRMQLQQPVRDCNPIDKGCRNNFADAETLPYCNQSSLGNAHVVKERCEYLDEFNVLPASTSDGSDSIFVPTRIKSINQKRLCKHCEQQFETTTVDTAYVADIENFTLLVDHSYSCADLARRGEAKDMQGFLRPCLAPHDCQLIPLDNLPAMAKFMKGEGGDNKTVADTRKFWNAGSAIPTDSAYSLPVGDVFRLGYLLDLFNVDLDSGANETFNNQKNPLSGSRRQEGFVIALQVHYSNFQYNTRPNQLPTIYEYRFDIAKLTTYKTTTVKEDEDAKQRTITDWHGVLFRSYQSGQMGAFSWRQSVLMLLEASFIFSLCRWFVRLVALNWFKGVPGDDLEMIVTDDYSMNIDAEHASKVLQRVKPRGSGYIELTEVQRAP